ncbi:DUF6932 family protein [Photobacterium kishitanii]|uniref:DUF6932 family protein n=1 Tax=Photobacterium kishitanii TaxID=318456 RepID=UPI000D161DA6|nr:hypothetical protein [Photobacterium kishitanii]PSV14950.1 hypothetical protein C0W28_16235 [Photobacterium kishitanii]
MIPNFNASGVLPPYLADDPIRPDSMSPYKIGLAEFVAHFATSPERKLLLRGFLNYRSKMKGLGFSSGFQWIDGSFVEDVEKIKGRAPADIDFVTFSELPESIQSKDDWDQLFYENQDLFDTDISKTEFMCDAYYVNIRTNPISLINQTRYWFGIFSHQRSTSLWKGILEIDFDEDESDALRFIAEGGDK